MEGVSEYSLGELLRSGSLYHGFRPMIPGHVMGSLLPVMLGCFTRMATGMSIVQHGLPYQRYLAFYDAYTQSSELQTTTHTHGLTSCSIHSSSFLLKTSLLLGLIPSATQSTSTGSNSMSAKLRRAVWRFFLSSSVFASSSSGTDVGQPFCSS